MSYTAETCVGKINVETKEELKYIAATERLEKVAGKLTTAFSIWALVVVVFGSGILYQQSRITDTITGFKDEFTSFVVISERRLSQLEAQDMLSNTERARNEARVLELQREFNTHNKNGNGNGKK